MYEEAEGAQVILGGAEWEQFDRVLSDASFTSGMMLYACFMHKADIKSPTLHTVILRRNSEEIVERLQ